MKKSELYLFSLACYFAGVLTVKGFFDHGWSPVLGLGLGIWIISIECRIKVPQGKKNHQPNQT
jgi:hypothetical protein